MLFKVFLLSFISLAFSLLDDSNWNDEANSRSFTTLNDALKDAEKFIEKLKENDNLPSLVFGIAVKGRPIWNKTWGHSDLENVVRVSLNTKFRLCSITKTFTSAFISKLVEDGKLTYDTPINQILSEKDFPKKQWHNRTVDITIGQLLSHMGGFRETDINTDFNDIRIVHNSIEMIHKFKDEPLFLEPGTKFNYSNYGFQLLGAIIEVITKKTYQEVAEEFFHHNQMKSSFMETPDLMINDRARYYRDSNGQNIPTMVLDELLMVEGYWSSGGILSTLGDMLHYGQLMVDSYKGRPNAILKSQTVKQMWTSRTELVFKNLTNFPVAARYAYGWINCTIEGKLPKYVYHEGGLPGTTTSLVIFPEQEIVGVAFTNKGAILDLDLMTIHTAQNIYGLV